MSQTDLLWIVRPDGALSSRRATWNRKVQTLNELWQYTEQELIKHYRTCTDVECMRCGVLECPHEEPLHLHHDSCPSCISHQQDQKTN